MNAIGIGVMVLSLLVAGQALAEEASKAGGATVQTFVTTPLEVVLKRYAAASGCRVERVEGVSANIVMPATGTLDPAGLEAAIGAALAQENIALFKIGAQRLVATWIDPARAIVKPRPSLAELLELDQPGAPAPAEAE